MSWLTIFRVIVVWYAMVQLVMVATLPLTLRVLRALPDKGYSFGKINGVLVVGVGYWLAYSYGLLRNERGGAWIALVAVAVASWLLGWSSIVAWWRSLRNAQSGGRDRLVALVVLEVIFALALVGWAIVRAYDPNADHTEQPMDLMFMSSLWASPTYPPQDAWLAGYAISYYYLGYWLLTTLGRLADTMPSIAYNIGQAVWYGLLWCGCFGVVMNLLAWRFGRTGMGAGDVASGTRIPTISLVGGVIAGVTVAFVGNLLVILEWLYAQGFNVDRIAAWIDVHNFPENANQTGLWYIDNGWWWWRSSRVIEDVDLLGRHIDISPIDEFPMFSYLLGDNHPHVTAMPVVLLVIGLALNLFLLLLQSKGHENDLDGAGRWNWLPLSWVDAGLYVMAVGSLVFLNTWDFPPYWLLLVAVIVMGSGTLRNGGRWRRALGAGVMMVLGTIAIYLPYFLTMQSQAGGIVPNVFHPTRFPQFLVMFGGLLPGLIGVLLLGWKVAKPHGVLVGWVAAFVLGVPIAFLAVAASQVSAAIEQGRVPALELPPDVTSYGQVILQRWWSEPWTLLLVGILLALLLACLVKLLQRPISSWMESADLVFVILLGAIGVALVYAPEFVFLRDNFGSRMNTVFKFYYQGWLLFGLACAYLIALALSRILLNFPRHISRHYGGVEVLAVVSILLVLGSAIYPLAGVYAKTGGFGRQMPTLDASAYVAQTLPDVMAAAEWVQLNTTPDQIVLEGRGNSYAAHHNRISTMTGRPTLLGWDGHESQWRGEAYGSMARGRPAMIEQVYRTAPVKEIPALLAAWEIDYVFVGPAEIELYGITQLRLDELGAEMDVVFSRGQVRIFRPRVG